MKIFRVIVPVSDIDQAAVFYAELLELEGKRVSPGRHYFDCEGVILACYDPIADGDEFDAIPNQNEIYLSSKDLERMRSISLKLDCPKVSEIEDQPWGERTLYVTDIFGNQLCFVDQDTLFRGS